MATHLTKIMLFAFSLPLVRSVTVTTKYGEIKGLITSYPNDSGPFKSVSKFLGVPFAAPPIGELRFKAPQPLKEWSRVREAKKHGPICWQTKMFEAQLRLFTANFSYSEDCLYLDVYTPNVTASLPVMVYIHGGGYELGTSITSASDVLALQGVVVVVIQYRLGPFGFLTTGDSASPGNYGMLDQVAALRWVKENIKNFGGNHNKVTIFGESAGGSSVSLHLLSPLSKDLVHQVIAESGVDLSPFAVQPTSFGLRFAKELAEKLNCPSSDHDAMVKCIREKDATDVQKAAALLRNKFTDYTTWGPVVDMNFLHDTPRNLRESGSFMKIPLMVCFTSHEGALFIGDMVNNSLELNKNLNGGVSPSLFKSFLTKLAHARNSGKETADLIADAMEFVYTPWPDTNDKYALRSQLVDLIGDYLFIAPSHEVADIHNRVAPVYMYEFAQRAKTTMAPEPWMGVVHAENIPFDFGIPLLPKFLPWYSEADRNVSLFIVTMYANFARSGDPSARGVTWDRYNSSHRAYLRVDTDPNMLASFYPRRMAFWNDYHPKLVEVKFDIKKEVVSGASAGVTIETFIQISLSLIFTLFSL